METISIIPSENSVYVNGERREVDCSSLDKKIHAVQWCHCPNRKKSKGHIEWAQDPLEDRKLNTELKDMKQFQAVIDAWHKTDCEEVKCKKQFLDLRIREEKEFSEQCDDPEMKKSHDEKRAELEKERAKL